MASRSKKAIINTAGELLLEVVTAICSFILPRLILSHFGSTYNGITTSISQFIGCVALLKSGIGGVTRAALYKPLAIRDYKGISEVVNATSMFMKKIAVLFTFGVLVFATVFPLLVSDDFEWFFSFSLVIILSLSTFAQYFFGLTYQMVLQADQKNYIISLVSIASVIINTFLSAILIVLGLSIHLVKLGSAFVFVIPPIFYNFYVKRKYKIDATVSPNYSLISQRWDAFGHQVANFVNQNTDIIIVTVILGVKEVSVYSIYYMIAHSIQKFLKAISTGVVAAFGNMLAKNEDKNLKIRFEQYEFLMFYLSTFLLIVAGLLITPFVKIYTKGVYDINYYRPMLGYLICVSIFSTSIKTPYEQIIQAAGAFKDTRNGAFIEAIMNILISIILAKIIGLNGIIIGTIVALTFRAFVYHIYVCQNIISRNIFCIFPKILYSILCVGVSVLISRKMPLSSLDNYFIWFIWAVVLTIIVYVICTTICFIFFKKEAIGIMNSLKTSLRIRK